MSGASGKVLAAIQVSPEAMCGGLIGKVRDGDIVTVDVRSGTLQVAGDEIAAREAEVVEPVRHGLGRELFAAFRERASAAESGGSLFARDF